MTPRVIDLSHHNAIPQSLVPAKQAGIIGLIHKCTEGSTHADTKVEARHYLALQANMAWGLYHFMRPGDMQAQARWFIDSAHRLGVIDDKTLLCADHEDHNVPLDDLIEWLEAVEGITGRVPIIYSGHVMKDQCASGQYPTKYKLWLCHYTTGTPTLPEGCDAYWLWQYSDSATVAGITPPTDVNHFEGSDEDFLASWSGGTEIVSPIPPAPVSGVVNVSITAPEGVEIKVTVNGTETVA
jgi:lysozyme